MDLQSILERIEVDFFSRIDRKAIFKKDEIEFLKREFGHAIKNVLILTYSRIMKDAKEP